jgi:hypothetical protein
VGVTRSRRLGVWGWVAAGAAGALAIIVLLGAFILVARATDATGFCRTCHEMQPYYDAWAQGGHDGHAQCIDCHVNYGFFPRLEHKFVALGEVWVHVFGAKAFPLPRPATVPDSRCVRCHQKVVPKPTQDPFSHELHAKQGPCQLCHATTGHDVTAQALQSAGVYSATNAAARAAVAATGVAAPGRGKADVAGHVTVICSTCHDMAATGCAACHAPPHEPLGDCKLCHRPGLTFTFVHPATRMPGWQRIDCKRCHPDSYTQVNCTCHRGRVPTGDD